MAKPGKQESNDEWTLRDEAGFALEGLRRVLAEMLKEASARLDFIHNGISELITALDNPEVGTIELGHGFTELFEHLEDVLDKNRVLELK